RSATSTLFPYTTLFRSDATIIENAGIGAGIGAEMRLQSSIRPILIIPRLDKQARLIAEAPKFEAGQIFLPREAPWLGSYLTELRSEEHTSELQSPDQLV